jgi:hypothetical protein
MRIVTSPSYWTVSLRAGGSMTIWADGYSEDPEYYVFSLLIDRDAGETGLEVAEIADRTPSSSDRLSIVTARVPTTAVTNIESRSR